jgi:hypothetical protein
MSTAYQEDISTSVLRRMKEGGFDFSQFHPIEFYAIFPDEERARRAAGHFRGESLNAQISARDDGAWSLELSRVMRQAGDPPPAGLIPFPCITATADLCVGRFHVWPRSIYLQPTTIMSRLCSGEQRFASQ